MTNSFFNRDIAKEVVLRPHLDKIYSKYLKLSFRRDSDNKLQAQGVDITFIYKNKDYYIDEKAQLSYINKDLKTFTFELSYFKGKEKKLGWLFDNKKITTHYFLITSIYAKDYNIKNGFEKCKILSVNRKKLLQHLVNIGLNKTRLKYYEDSIRQNNSKKKKFKIDELNIETEGCLFYSHQLNERPINLQLKLEYLIKKGIGKQLFNPF
uniref:hypothetical protein n=1 Tax=uncultured Polaribacter sp. TaxID=174711 RepID=UPI002631FBC0|nr:hypothetical protein [uncultured Polaribacter sp.]